MTDVSSAGSQHKTDMQLKQTMENVFDKSHMGFVVIGRNEGKRLEESLHAIKRLCPDSPLIYVDSNSSDNSVSFARSLGFSVIELDMSIPFSAARARNEGYRRLLESHNTLRYIHFIDGDCEIQPGWVETALETLEADDKIGIVSGRIIEKRKQASIFNTLIDIEWQAPSGEAKALPGIIIAKVDLLKTINGYSNDIIAAEDDELCIRARAAGYKLMRLDTHMVHHDANITRLTQWYKRAKRCGHAYAHLNHLYGGQPEYYFRSNLRSTTAWGGIFPFILVISLLMLPLVAALLILAYMAILSRLALKMIRQGYPAKISIIYACLIYTSKVAEFSGVIKYWKTHFSSRKHQIIEYK